ncbi:NAD(P)-binding domain-containing protein [Ensifer sp. LC163]|uniref:NAD(P)-binding domain-containing protein n=1 Tax=Ensifer sp. LC163 TaxID=1120652 RepID=UPI0011125D17
MAVEKPLSAGLSTPVTLPAGNHLRLRAYWCHTVHIVGFLQRQACRALRGSIWSVGLKPAIRVLGTGRMGAALAFALIQAGDRTSIRNKTTEKTRPSAAAGATVAAADRMAVSCLRHEKEDAPGPGCSSTGRVRPMIYRSGMECL